MSSELPKQLSKRAMRAAANGINIVLDQQLIADIKALIHAIESYAKSAGVPKPGAAAK